MELLWHEEILHENMLAATIIIQKNNSFRMHVQLHTPKMMA